MKEKYHPYIYLAIASMPGLAIASFGGWFGIGIWGSVILCCAAVLYAIMPLWGKKR